MNPLEGVTVLLGVTGSIAAYKAADLASKLTQAGAHVDTILTYSIERRCATILSDARTARHGLDNFLRLLDGVPIGVRCLGVQNRQVQAFALSGIKNGVHLQHRIRFGVPVVVNVLRHNLLPEHDFHSVFTLADVPA